MDTEYDGTTKSRLLGHRDLYDMRDLYSGHEMVLYHRMTFSEKTQAGDLKCCKVFANPAIAGPPSTPVPCSRLVLASVASVWRRAYQ